MSYNGIKTAAIVLGASIFCFAGVAGAQSTGKVVKGQVGATFGVVPDYEGSDDYEYFVWPTGRVTLWDILFVEGGSFHAGRPEYGAVGAHLFRRPNFRAGPIVKFAPSRDVDDNDQLTGLGDVDIPVEVGFYGEAKVNNFLLRVDGTQDVNESHEGFLLGITAQYEFRPWPKVRFTGGVSTSWASDSYMEAYYGVSAAQSAASGLTRFTAESGFKELGLSFKGAFNIDQNWGINAQVSYRRMLQDAADSPIVDVIGDPNQYTLTTGFSYRF